MNYANKDNIEQLLFKTDITVAQISRETGIRTTVLGKYRRGESLVGNMSLDNAITLQGYYLKLEEENNMSDKMSREEAFGRSMAVLDKVSQRHFEKMKPNAELKYRLEFDRKPMDTFYQAHKDVTTYADKFNEIDIALIDRLNHYIGAMDPADYNNDPLAPVYLIYISKESVLLDDLIKNNLLIFEEDK